jgi:acyl-CoA reductase-like NAD-dependent aldehyde dehydrogenase
MRSRTQEPNGTVLEPAEEAPLTALRIAELAVDAGLPTGL